MKNQSSIRKAGEHRKSPLYFINRKLRGFFPFKFLFLLLSCAVFQQQMFAQNIVFNSTPETTVPELGNYSYDVKVVTPDNKPITFSGQGFPSWLTLGTSTGAPTTVTSSIGVVNGLVADQNGNIYAAQSSTTGKIYKVDKDGNTTVFADKISTGSTASMIIVDNYLYASHSAGATGIVRYDLTQSNPAPVAVYSGYSIYDLTYHDGAIYATTSIQQKIVRLDLNTNVATDFLTTPSACLATEFDQNGDLLIADAGGNVRKYSFATSSYTTVISGLAFAAYELQWDTQGNLYTSSAAGIRKYSSTFTLLATAAASVSYDLTFTPDGALVYAPLSTGGVYALTAMVALGGSPSHADVGSYPVKIIASNGTVSEEQEFTITVTDPNAPLLTANSPTDNATDIPGTAPLVLTFNENVKPGAGNIEFRRWPDGFPLASINVNDALNAVFNNSTVTINHLYLPNATEVYVYVPAGAIVDMSDNPFAGFNNETITFTTFNCSATLSAANEATTFCPGNSVILSASQGMAYEWRQNNILIADATSPTFIASQSGAYRVIVTDNLGCRDTSDVVQLNAINVDATVTGPSTIPCDGEVTLTAPQAMASYEWYYNGQPSGGSGNTLKTNKAGSYTVRVTNEGCTLTTATAFIVTLDMNGDCDSDGLTNGAECPGGINCPDNDNDGRPDYLQNDKSQPIIMPKLFSPNGDGINDIITPVTPGLKTFTSLKIYNRWGNLVFESRDRDKGWDGKTQGKPQPNDSYVWICTGTDYNGRTFSTKGIFTLIR